MDIVVEGVTYHQIQGTTMEQDDAIMREVRRVPDSLLEQRPDEDADAYSLRLLSDLIAEGLAAGILAAMFVPEGQAWTRDVARASAEKFRATTDPDSKQSLRDALVPVLSSFFVHGLLSVKISKTYSSLLGGVVGQPQHNEEASIWASGKIWFARSLMAILPARWRLRVGQFARRSSPTLRS